MMKWTTIYWSLAGLGGLWAIFVSLLLSPQIQKHALYAHRFHTAWWHDLNRPETFGFAEGQVTPFRVTTPDNQSLYAWHILPLSLYADVSEGWHLESRNNDIGLHEDPVHLERMLGYLKDRNTRLIVNFHGNAGHLAQGWRTDAYKSLPSADNRRIHMITFDYRGFANSTGEPSEAGLITDGIAVLDWAMNVAGVTSSRITLVGQSLGTAVATAVAEHFAKTRAADAFAGLVLCSGFSDIPTLMKTYAIGGFIPILSPLKPYPRLEKFFADRVVDRWNTTQRLAEVAALQPSTKIRIFHAKNDYDIGWKHSDLLFDAAFRGVQRRGPLQCKTGIKHDLAEIGQASGKTSVQNSIEVVSRRVAREVCVKGHENQTYKVFGHALSRTLLRYGGHNHLLASNYVAVAIKELFDEVDMDRQLKGASEMYVYMD